MTLTRPPPPPRPRWSPPPAQLLAAARTIAGRPDQSWGSSWSRAAAYFTRQALEEAVGDLWCGASEGMKNARFTSQMICLSERLDDPELARRVYLAWCQLSSACHAHPYELAPTAEELQRWAATVAELIAQGPAKNEAVVN